MINFLWKSIVSFGINFYYIFYYTEFQYVTKLKT